VSSIHRGDVVSFRPPGNTAGHEQKGTRYGVVLQSDHAAWLSTVFLAPLSRGAQTAVFRPELTFKGQRTRVLLDQLKAIDRGRLGRLAGRLSAADLREVDAALRDVLGLV